MILLLACIPAALLCGVLWGVALEKSRAARRRDKTITDLLERSRSPLTFKQPDDPKPRRRAF